MKVISTKNSEHLDCLKMKMMDLLEAEKAGDALVTDLLNDRILSNNVSFFDTTPTTKLEDL